MKRNGIKKTGMRKPPATPAISEADLRLLRRKGFLDDWGDDMTLEEEWQFRQFVEKLKKEGKL